jgi:hypothetical protein
MFLLYATSELTVWPCFRAASHIVIFCAPVAQLAHFVTPYSHMMSQDMMQDDLGTIFKFCIIQTTQPSKSKFHESRRHGLRTILLRQ